MKNSEFGHIFHYFWNPTVEGQYTEGFKNLHMEEPLEPHMMEPMDSETEVSLCGAAFFLKLVIYCHNMKLKF
jgi:hypothetical protein